MYNVVFDTNVFLSTLIKNQGICAQLFTSIFQTKYSLITSQQILNEIKEVGSRKYFRKYFSTRVLNEFVNEISINSKKIVVTKYTNDFYFNDLQDKAVYDLFVNSRSDYLVTGNIRDFPKSNRIIQPGDFVKILLGQ